MKTVRLDHLRAALLAVAAAGLLAAAGLVVPYAQPAEANYPGKPGKIAFAGYERNDSEIYTINASGGGKRQLTNNSTRDRFPYYSPSGRRIAYVNDAGADREIYTIKPNGGVSTKSSTTPRLTLILTGAVSSDFSLRVVPEV